MLSDADIAHYRAFGFVAVRQAFDPVPLAPEIDRAFAGGFVGAFEVDVGGGGHYLPMMVEDTPVSLDLLDGFAAPAAVLLGRPVLPLRAKAVLYFAGASWHTDSERAVASIGFAAYLEPLRAASGALRVIPGSHRPEFGAAVRDVLAAGRVASVADLPGYAVETDPGDVVVFDEHLYHASTGGTNRRQWRVDYVIDPVGAAEEAEVRAYFAGTYLPDWDGGYDVDRYPTYGPHWLASGRAAVPRLAALGAYDLAAAEEAFARSRRTR